MNRLMILLLTLTTSISCSSQKKSDSNLDLTKYNFTIHNEFKTYFDNCGVEGSIAIFDNKNQQWILSDTTKIKSESLPASTFKIINLLIALETKTIQDENEIVKWVGKTDTLKYGFRPEIYHDMSVKEAFEVSAGWVFIELAKKIGKENYRKYLKASNYGNKNLSENYDDFWNFGAFAISPINQVEFLKNLYEEKLPFSKRNIEIVKKVMITEQTDDYTIRAKTGWTRENNTNTGWWVGYSETKNNTYFFATRLLQDRKDNRDDFGSCRKEITKKIFRDLGLLNQQSKISDSLFIAIDHIPIVVNDLEKAKDIFKNQLHFTIKDGKTHEGIKNCFLKFQDGTYLEFIEPLDSLHTIGKYYSTFRKKRQGGTSLAISTTNAESVKKMLNEKHFQFTADSNRIWETIEPKNFDLFFIEYTNKNWKEKAINTTHLNSANSQNATYILTDNFETEIKKYKALGFNEVETGMHFETPYKLFRIGHSRLYLLDGTKSKKVNQLFNNEKLQGICGFEIKVSSLKAFNKLTTKKQKIKYEVDRTTIYFKEYNLFLTFKE